ncbi:MAG: hypothetical protein KUG78_06900 [Kangiellaceae bacterium]|nr:hypothetical protein [Kangiellaceae bacterium]
MAKASKSTKATDSTRTKITNKNLEQSSNQLSSIRELLFGDQVAVLEKTIEQHNQTINKRLDSLEAMMKKNALDFSSQLAEAQEKIVHDLEENRLEHVSQEGILEEKLKSIENQLSEHQQQTEKEFTHSHNSLVQTAKELEQSLIEEVRRLNGKIEASSAELSTNKADRKTLASLLESMASNLTESQA